MCPWSERWRICFALLSILPLSRGGAGQVWGGSQLPGEGGDSSDCLATALGNLISALNWTRVLIIFQEDTARLYEALIDELSGSGLLTVGMTADRIWSPRGLETLIPKGPDAHQDPLQVLALTSTQTAGTLLQKASDLERDFGLEACIRECTQWLLALTPGSSSHPDYLPLEDVTLNNVATVTAMATGGDLLIHTLKLTPGGRVFVQLGSLSACNPTDLPPDIFPNLSYKLNGRKFRIIVRGAFDRFTYCPEGGNSSVCGIGAELLIFLAAKLNFTYEISVVDDGQYGAMNADGSWTGLIGALQRQEADVALATLSTSADRKKVADFTVSFYTGVYSFCYRRPSDEAERWRLYLRPLTWPVILLLGGVALLASCHLHLICALSPGQEQGRPLVLRDSGHFLRCLRGVLGATIGCASDRQPVVTSGRVLMASWWLTCMVVMAAFSGNLVAFLADTRHHVTIRTVADLLSQSQYTWGLDKGNLFYHIISKSTLPMYRGIWKGVVEFNKTDPGVLSIDFHKLFKKLQDEKFVYFGSRRNLKVFAMSKGVEIDCGHEALAPDDNCLALTKDSAYTHYFSQTILRLVGSGLYEEWQRRKQRNLTRTRLELNPAPRAAKLVDTQAAFFCLLIGGAVSAVTLLAEWLYNRRKSRDSSE